MDTSTYKTVRYSRTTLTELMIPSYANFGGKVHGGILLALMDKLAYVCAAKHAGNYCVTASIHNVDFLAAVEVGDLVSLKASVNYVGRSSLIVGIRIEAENVKTQSRRHTNTSYFTMVAMDESHKPVEVPGLVLESAEEVRRFHDAMVRHAMKRENRGKPGNAEGKIAGADEQSIAPLLSTERCVIKIRTAQCAED